MSAFRHRGHGRRRGRSFARPAQRQRFAPGRPSLRGVVFPSPFLFHSRGSLMAPTFSNLPRSLQKPLRGSGTQKRQETRQAVAQVDAGRCTGCGACVNVCPMGAVSLCGVARVDSTRCAGCGLCVEHCPVGAISVTGEMQGRMITSGGPSGQGSVSQWDE
jgi:ferredoxin